VNHLVNANKMVSDTPRTDAEAFWPHDSQYKVCDAVFARQLEGELNAANGNVERLTKANIQLREGCEEMKQRIKRLEEVGDKMEIYCDTILARDWKEAKEAKP
jgi:hypothetical protein